MLGYLEIDAFEGGLEVQLIKEDWLGRFTIQYHKTTQQICKVSERIEGIVIPHDLGKRYAYDLLLMILHIRLSANVELNQLPIIVSFETDDQYLEFGENHTITEKVYNSIGVSISDPELPDRVEFPEVDKSSLKDFLKEKAGHPWFTQGRHDQSNRWGPYVFLSVLNEVFGGYSDAVKSVEDSMFEEPYLKWLARGISFNSYINNKKTDLVLACNKLKAQLKAIERKKILIVEDKLDDGWRHVYEAVLLVDGLGIEITWAQTKQEALERFRFSAGELGLVILDMRLGNDDMSENEPTGLVLAKEFRKSKPSVPIIVATASNKSWLLQKLTDEGIDAYWVKASPESDLDFSHAAENVLDFYKKVTSTLEWSSKTRRWTEHLYQIATEVSETDPISGKYLEEKAHSFHALMKKSFSPFSEDISKGLQQNLAFIIAYSCMNDLVSWVLSKAKLTEDGSSNLFVWNTKDGKREELLRQRKNSKGKVIYQIKDNTKEFIDFPDKGVALKILLHYGTKRSKEFKQMSELRNGLPLIHGKSAELGTHSAPVNEAKENDITIMISILSDLVKKAKRSQ